MDTCRADLKKVQNQIHPTVLKVVLSTKFDPIHGLLAGQWQRQRQESKTHVSIPQGYVCPRLPNVSQSVRYWGLQASKRISTQSNVQPRMQVQQLFIGCWEKSIGNTACLTFWNRFQFETVCRAQSLICCTHCPENLYTFFHALIYIGFCNIYEGCR